MKDVQNWCWIGFAKFKLNWKKQHEQENTASALVMNAIETTDFSYNLYSSLCMCNAI